MRCRIPHNRPWITAADREAVVAVLKSGWIAPGSQVEALESEMCSELGGGYGCATMSGTAALYLALRVLGVGEGCKVIVPTYACVALLNAVFMARASPVVVDVESVDLNIDPVQVRDAVNRERISAIIAVHTFGYLANVQALKSFNIPVIEDCCQSLGAQVPDSSPPDDSISVYSFFATKVVTGGQGGLVRSHDPALMARVRRLIEFSWGEQQIPRFNFQLSDLQAALVRSQFRRINQIRDRRREIARQYLEAFRGDRLQTPAANPGGLHYRFVIRAADSGQRDKLLAHFQRQGIEASSLYRRHELLHRLLKLEEQHFGVAEDLVERLVSIPLFPALTDAHVDRICRALRDAAAMSDLE